MNNAIQNNIKLIAKKFGLHYNQAEAIITSYGKYVYKLRKAVEPASHYGPTITVMYLGKFYFKKKAVQRWNPHNGQDEKEASLRFKIRFQYLLLGNEKNMDKEMENNLYLSTVEEVKNNNLTKTQLNNLIIKQIKDYGRS